MNFVTNIGKNCIILSALKASRIRPNILFKNFSEKSLDVNTNVTKDVILFKHEQDKFYKIINTFGICQFGLWSYLSLFAMKSLKDVPVDKKTDEPVSWWRAINLGEPKYRYGITCVAFGVGFSMLAVTWLFTLRSVKYLILRKGGDQVTLVTYGPFGKNRMFTLPLTNISAKQTRSEARAVLPLKVKGHMLHYMLDMRGEFKNAKLFEHTAGLKRTWK